MAIGLLREAGRATKDVQGLLRCWPEVQQGGPDGQQQVHRDEPVLFFWFFPFLHRTFLPQLLPRSLQWRSATGSAAPGRRSPPVGHATHGRALEPTGICEELVQSRLRSSSTHMGFAGQLDERSGKRSLRSHGNDTAPSLNPCVLRSGAERRRRTRRPHAREHAEEGCGFRRPAPAHLDAEHDEAAAARPAELRSLQLHPAARRPPRRKIKRVTAPQKITASRKVLPPALPHRRPAGPPKSQPRC